MIVHRFTAGNLVSRVYEDVPPALRRWTEEGRKIYVYSSGSELAQRLWFRHSQSGDLEAFVSGHFDTVSGGPKRDPASYSAIARALSAQANQILFLTDSAAELEAARAAGWHAVGVSRADDGSPELPGLAVTSFDAVDLAELDGAALAHRSTSRATAPSQGAVGRGRRLEERL